MKKNISPVILAVFSIVILSDSFAGNPVLSAVEKEKKTTQLVDYSDVPSREFISFRLSEFDQFENKYILNVSGSFGKRTEENSYTDTLHYHTPSGGIYYNEYITHQLDQLGRDTMISWTNNEGGSPNYALKKRFFLNYYKDSPRLLERYTELLGFEDLGLAKSEVITVDKFGNEISFNIKNYDPSSGIVISFTSDSIQISYDITGNISEQTYFSYDAFQERMIPTENRIYDSNGDTITSIVVNALNQDGSFNFPKYKINNISSTKVPDPFKVLHELKFGVDPWEDAASFRRSKYLNDKWEPEYVQDRITFDRFTVTTSRLEENEPVPWKRTIESNFHQSLYNKMKYILPRTETETYYKDYVEETYIPDDDEWLPLYRTRNAAALGVAIAFGESNIKSATAEDSVLTLIKQTFDPGSGEWIDNFKQEFVFRNLATNTREEMENMNNFTIFPNPNSGVLNVSFNNVKELSRISIVNAAGQTVFTSSFDDFSGTRMFTADLKHLNKGMYFVQVYSGNNIFSKKLILQ